MYEYLYYDQSFYKFDNTRRIYNWPVYTTIKLTRKMSVYILNDKFHQNQPDSFWDERRKQILLHYAFILLTTHKKLIKW